MEINTPDEFREQPVVDVVVDFTSGRSNAWTINDEPANQLTFVDGQIRFKFLNTLVSIERRNVEWWGLSHRIDRIPVKKEGAPTASAQQPEGGVAGLERD